MPPIDAAGPIPHADRDSEHGGSDCESDPEPGPADPASASEPGYPNNILNISQIYL